LTLNRLDEAFLFERSIDIDTYDRHADRVREQFAVGAGQPPLVWNVGWPGRDHACHDVGWLANRSSFIAGRPTVAPSALWWATSA
jgi:hypothetical protein